MPNQILMMLMNQVRAKNPQIFNQIEQLRKNNGNPMELFKQVTSNYNDEQMNNLWKNVKQFGIPDEAIQQFQNQIQKK